MINLDPQLTTFMENIRAERNSVAHPTVTSEKRKELLTELKDEVPEADYIEYVKIFDGFEKLEKANIF